MSQTIAQEKSRQGQSESAARPNLANLLEALAAAGGSQLRVTVRSDGGADVKHRIAGTWVEGPQLSRDQGLSVMRQALDAKRAGEPGTVPGEARIRDVDLTPPGVDSLELRLEGSQDRFVHLLVWLVRTSP